MSFSSQVKDELSSLEQIEQCCLHAQTYGLLLFGRSFSPSSIGILTEHESVALLYIDNVQKITGVTPKLLKSKAGKYTVTINTKEERLAVLSTFGHSGTEVSIRINRANLADECCQGAFLRGAFLSCGTITTPEKTYHLEFVVPRLNISRDLVKLMTEVDFYPKQVVRKGSYVVYFKDSASIEDVLTYIGATNSSLELMGIKMHKDMRNNINRKINFDTANITRLVDAAAVQLEAIEKIKNTCGFDALSEELREMAELRLENPEMSLRELGEQLKEPISRSGVNHRLKRIIEISRSL